MYYQDLTVRIQQGRSTCWRFGVGASTIDALQSDLRKKDNCETVFAIKGSMSQRS
jgi:hypothetical protein